MAKYEFKVGDRVQFKTWDEMVKEYGGVDEDGDIRFSYKSPFFDSQMKHLCGTYATVKEIDSEKRRVYLSDMTARGDKIWSYTFDMLKPASTKKQKKDEPITYPTITAHLIEGNKTTVMLSDGRIGEVTCYYKDTFDPAVGVAGAYKKALDITKAEDKPIVKEVKRPAKKGEYVKVVDANLNLGYQNGDILKVILKIFNAIVADSKGEGVALWQGEYVVLEGYDPDIHGKI